MKKILILFSLLFCFQPVNALTKSQIISEVRRLVQDSNGTSRQRWTDLQISTFINMAQDEIVSLTWCLHNEYHGMTRSGTTNYVMPETLFVPERVYYDNKVLPEISESKLDSTDENWISASTATPTYYYIHRTTVTWLGLYPSPDNAKSLDVYYYEQPANLDNDNSRPFNNCDKLNPYHYLIVLWVTHYCFLQEGKIATATQFYNLYSLRIKDMKDSLNLRPNYYPNISGN